MRWKRKKGREEERKTEFYQQQQQQQKKNCLQRRNRFNQISVIYYGSGEAVAIVVSSLICCNQNQICSNCSTFFQFW